jgi:hypothetical protein
VRAHSGKDALYRNPIEEVVEFFALRHPGRYKIYNLCSEREYEPQMFAGPVARFPFDDHNPCPLELIGRFCEDVDVWLGAHAENVIAVHCKAGKGRTGLMISCYLIHSRLAADAVEALAMFSKNRTKDGKGVTIPRLVRCPRRRAPPPRRRRPDARTPAAAQPNSLRALLRVDSAARNAARSLPANCARAAVRRPEY